MSKELAERLSTSLGSMVREWMTGPNPLDGDGLETVIKRRVDRFLCSLPPPEGVGLALKRYYSFACVDYDDGLDARTDPDGGWVAYEDAATALAAEEARTAEASRQRDDYRDQYVDAHDRAEAAEAENKRMAAALGERHKEAVWVRENWGVYAGLLAMDELIAALSPAPTDKAEG